jgi:hypothetical protein
MLVRRVYYALKPMIPRRLQLLLRRLRVRYHRLLHSDVWPICEKAGKRPEGWTGWPEDKRAALILAHDVETEKGLRRCRSLAELEESMGFRSAFYFVPERYEVSPALRRYLADKGFEVGVHGLRHDGRLFGSRKTFQRRAVRINEYIRDWNSCGFGSPGTHHNLEWILDLDIKYDVSTYDTDPFEPQGGGLGTIFPLTVRNSTGDHYYIEIPYTVAQDFTLFVLMKEESIDIWKRKVDWIFERGGLVHLKTHPDYMNFSQRKGDSESYPIHLYARFLEYIREQYGGCYWHVLPKELADYWSSCRPESAQSMDDQGPECLSRSLNRLVKGKRISYFPLL